MSYRLNKDKRNSQNSSFNKRGSNFSRKDNDETKSKFNDRRRTNNKNIRFSSNQSDQYSNDNQPLEKSRNNSQLKSNYRANNRFVRN